MLLVGLSSRQVIYCSQWDKAETKVPTTETKVPTTVTTKPYRERHTHSYTSEHVY